MTWHLKDRDLEKKLIERFPSFVYELGKHCESSENFNFSVKLCRKGFCYYTDEMTFSKDELEEVPEYNPKAWNDSRKVTPPQNTIFRAKVYLSGLGEETIVEYDCLIYQYCSWYRVRDCKPYGGRLNITKDDHVEFRPWED